MHNRLSKLRAKRADGDKGFTLIELLVVVVIIGILIAIAIPLYLNYKKGANDKATQSDLRNAINVLEQCNTDNATYPLAAANLATTPTACTGQTVNTSSGTTLNYIPATTTSPNTGYILVGYNSAGNTSTAKYYCYASAKGGSIATLTSTIPTTYPSGGTCPAS